MHRLKKLIPRGKKSIIIVLLVLVIAAVTGTFFAFSEGDPFPMLFNFNHKEQIPWPPKIINAIYLTAWSTTLPEKINSLINLASTTEINAVVLDVKDWSGKVFYETNVSEVKKYKTEQKIIPNIKSLLAEFRGRGIYTIARIVVFEDPALAAARPDLAIRKESNKSLIWKDNLGLAWVDPASREVWDYDVKLAQDTLSQGFDEVNFDYVRFPSDGDINGISFPVWDGQTPKNIIIRDFFRYIRKQMPKATLSVDIFGLTTVSKDDMGIGQIIEDAYENFDFVSPMIYPSHFANGFNGYKNSAEHASELIKFSLESATARLNIYPASSTLGVKLRPWLQDFNLGAEYDKNRVRSEIDTVAETLGVNYVGYVMWNPKNVYTTDAFPLKENGL